MKRIIVLFAIFIFLALPAFAEVYVLVDDSTGSVVSVSPEDDAVLQDGQSKVILKRDYETLILNRNPQDYKYINGKFIEDIKKISDRENANIVSSEKKLEKDMVIKKAMKMACDKLIADGVTFKHISCSDFE